MNSLRVAASLLCFLFAQNCLAELDINGGLPQNHACHAGDEVIHECRVTPTTVSPRIQWREFAYNENGNLVSDGIFLSPVHPHFNRYRIVTTSAVQFALHIVNVTAADSGTYLCTDANAPLTDKYRHSAELIVLTGVQECTTTIPSPPTATLDGTYYSSECVVNYGRSFIRPSMVWQGPQPFGQGQSITEEQGWNGMSFYSQAAFHNLYWTSTVFFSGNFLPVPADVADNIPTLTHDHHTERILVHWPPRAMYAEPIKPLNEYEVGDAIECFADAFPAAGFVWTNLRTNEQFTNSIFIVPNTWLGTTQVMRCQASNTINGGVSNADHIITVNVPMPTTPTTPPTTTPTTPPPAEAPCDLLSGLWESNDPELARSCFEVDPTGNVHGVLRQGYQTFWYDLIGQTNHPDFDHISFTAIWPLNRAVTTFIGECSKCHGNETLIVSAVSRSKGTGQCGFPGEITYTEQYTFFRRTDIDCPPITIPTI